MARNSGDARRRAPHAIPTGAKCAAALRLRVLATSDLHHNLAGWDFVQEREDPGAGLARLAAAIAGARAEAPNAILVDNGDLIQSTPLGELWARDPPDAPQPMIAAMNLIGYDAAGPGNHDFDYGAARLRMAVEQARFPFVCANLSAPGAPDFPPYVILERQVTDANGLSHLIRIGVLGLAPPPSDRWNGLRYEVEVDARDMLGAAREAIPPMRAAGADVIVALAHTGIGAPDDGDGAEDAAGPLARLGGIDAIVAGHRHAVFPSPEHLPHADIDPVEGRIAGVPVVMPGFGGSHLGVIDLDLARTDGGWRVVGGTGSVRPVAALFKPDPAVAALAAPVEARAIRHMREVVGQSARPLHTYFAAVTDAAALRLVADAKRRAVSELIAGTPDAALPVVAAALPFRGGGVDGRGDFTDVKAGPVTRRDIADLYVYANTLRALRLTGADLVEWLERNASLYATLVPGVSDQPLLISGAPIYRFELIAGLTYEIDPSRPPRYFPDGRLRDKCARRVVRMMSDGRAVRPDDRFVVATSGHRAANLGQVAGGSEIALPPDIWIRDLIERRLAGPELEPAPRERIWRFAAVPGTTAMFTTGAGAVRHTNDPELPAIELVEEPRDGLSRFRLRF